MTLLTKQEIEALLDGTTPGPLSCQTFDAEADIYGPDGNLIAEVHGAIGGTAPANARLFTKAPDLARTALDALARLEDAKAAQALVVEQAAEAAYTWLTTKDPSVQEARYQAAIDYFKTDIDRPAEQVRDVILALAPASGVEALAALRAERDVLRADRDSAARMWQAAEQEKEAAVARSREASQMLAIETNHATQAEAERDAALTRLAAALRGEKEANP